jgi:hypothetical protein
MEFQSIQVLNLEGIAIQFELIMNLIHVPDDTIGSEFES